MNYKFLHRLVGFFVFFIAALVYFMTVQPSVSFWDCGEFIASSYLMQVPHPPGTPFFLILGRLFSMIPFAENIAFRVNTVSVLSSAFTVLFLYLVAVKVIENYKDKKHEGLLDGLGTLLASAAGALSLAFAGTFWFNAVEAEVYALSVFFIGFVTWIIMLWNEKADEPDNEKYLLFIAYLMGLSVGVHLMAVLAIVPIVMVIMFRKYITDEETLKESGQLFVVHSIIVLLVAFGLWYSQSGMQPPSPDVYNAFDLRFLVIMAILSLVFVLAFRKKIFNVNSFYLPILLGGVALIVTYPGVVKYVPNLVSSIGQSNIVLDLIILAAIFGAIFFAIHWTNKNNKQTSHLIAKAFLFILLGFTTYSMIIIRANQEPPINLNSPKTFPEVVSYLNRAQYGDFPTFKRRFTQEPHQAIVYNNYNNDLDFFLNYQMQHMFNRYLAWNYIGRTSTVQDTGVNWSQLYGVPFFIGLFGLFWHFRKDWKMASIFLVMFIFLGYLTAFYQNQQQPQPRERDYFYVGAFFVYSLWIALGIRGIIDLVTAEFRGKSYLRPVLAAVMILAFFLVPFNMLYSNYFKHDRSENFVPWDYSYNLLQSVEENAILFTNGDNDTFPLWYLQDVEGVRQDVRIANLSLLNTGWYIKQLKNGEPHGAKKIKMSFSDAEIDMLRPDRWEPRTMSLDVPDDVYREFGVEDTSRMKDRISWVMENTVQFGSVKAVRVQDITALDIIRNNVWDRPVYFAVTVSDDSRIGLNDYLQMEGLSFRVTPLPRTSDAPYVNADVLKAQLFDEPDGYSKDYRPGFKFRGLDNPNIFFDENHRRLSQNYRNSFIRLALYYHYNDQPDMTVETLDEMEKKIPREVIPMDYRLLYDVSRMYYGAGAMERYGEVITDVIAGATADIEANPKNIGDRFYGPYFILQDVYEKLGEYDKLVQLFETLQRYFPNDQNLQNTIERYRRLAAQQDTTNSEIPQN